MTRREAAVVGVVVVVLGLASRRFPVGSPLWDKSLGDVLYAVMVGSIVAFVRPSLRPAQLGISAFLLSFAVELFQLTGIPRRMPGPLHYVFGTTFAWHDVACYVVGGVVLALLQWRRLRRA